MENLLTKGTVLFPYHAYESHTNTHTSANVNFDVSPAMELIE